MNTKSSFSDAQILKDSQDYPWMFGMLVDRYQEPFYRKALYLLRSSDEAEDAVQDTFLRIYKYAHKFIEREGASFNSWAYKVLTNTCHSRLSKVIKNTSRVKIVDSADLDVYASPDALENREQASFVQSVLCRLPHKFSRLLSLYFLEEKSYEEIARAENISLSAVRSGLHRAKKQFKNIAIEMI